MALAAGRLRQRVTIMRKTRTVDANGGAQTAWAPVGTPVRAEVLGLGGRETMIATALQGITAYKITIRHRDDLTAADQLQYRTLTLNIRAIDDPDGLREQLVILADTGSPEKIA